MRYLDPTDYYVLSTGLLSPGLGTRDAGYKSLKRASARRDDRVHLPTKEIDIETWQLSLLMDALSTGM